MILNFKKQYSKLRVSVATFQSLVLSFILLITLLPDAHALEIKKQTLPNGLKVIHVERHNLPIVIANLIIKASPLNEPEDKAGVAYLTGALLTEGTHKRKATDISEEIEFIGASLNTSTNSDFTTISLSILKKDIEKGFEIFSDILLNPLFSETEISRKKDLIKGSLRQSEEDPSFLAEKAFIKEVFGKHPYGRLTVGSTESIENIKREDILNFYNDYYLPNNAIFTVVGNLTSEELNSLIAKYLGSWKPKNIKKSDHSSHLKKLQERRVIQIDKDTTQATIYFGHIGISRDNPDYYAVTVMNYILGGGGFASRLMKVIRDQMGLTYSIYSSFSVNKEIGQFNINVQTKNESAGVVIKEILNQIHKIKTEPVLDHELQDAKAYLIGSFPRRLETSRKIADFLAAAEFYNLGDDYIKKYPEYINNVTKEDILRVAKKYLDTDNYVLVIVGNQKNLNLSNFK